MGALLVCPGCAHEWSESEATDAADSVVVKDGVGNELQAGDTVTVIKDLKITGCLPWSSLLSMTLRLRSQCLICD
jgi:protein PhnA